MVDIVIHIAFNKHHKNDNFCKPPVKSANLTLEMNPLTDLNDLPPQDM